MYFFLPKVTDFSYLELHDKPLLHDKILEGYTRVNVE